MFMHFNGAPPNCFKTSASAEWQLNYGFCRGATFDLNYGLFREATIVLNYGLCREATNFFKLRLLQRGQSIY